MTAVTGPLPRSVCVVCNGEDQHIEPDLLHLWPFEQMTRYAKCLKRESRCVGGAAHLDY